MHCSKRLKPIWYVGEALLYLVCANVFRFFSNLIREKNKLDVLPSSQTDSFVLPRLHYLRGNVFGEADGLWYV